MNLVQVKPLLHNSSRMEYKDDKIQDNISETSRILQIDDRICLAVLQIQFKTTVVYSTADVFVMGLCVTLIVAIVHTTSIFSIFGPSRNKTIDR